MAMQAGLGVSKIVILVGAGVGGSIVLRNSKISDLISDLSRVLGKHLKQDGEGSSSDGGENSAIAAQVRRLTMELRQLAASNRPITVVNGSSGSGVNYSALVLPATVLGVAGYGYMWLKGWTLSDFMYVSKRHMSTAVASVSKQLDQVSSALVATKRHLTTRLDFMSRGLEENTAVTNAIQGQVGVVRGEVAQVGLEMREVNKHIEGLEGKIDEVAEKQDFANQGIVLLCRFVLQGLEGNGQKPELLQGFHAYSRTRLDRSASTPPFLASSGLKELQSISERLLMSSPGVGQADANGFSSPTLQRSLTTGMHNYVPRTITKT